MKINFPNVYFPKIDSLKNNYANNTVSQPKTQPLAYDTFEKVSFGRSSGDHISASRFPIKAIPNLRCPICGLITLTNEQIEDFVRDVSDKKGPELAQTLEKYEDESIFTGVQTDPPKTIFRPQKQEIVNVIKQLAIENPNKMLSTLVQEEGERRMNDLIAVQLEVADELEEYITQCSDKDVRKESAIDTIDFYRAEMKGEGPERFARKRFIYALSGMGNTPEVQERITEIAQKLPSSENNVDSWFVKYSRPTSSSEIARKLVQQSIPTTEHLQPRSKSGPNHVKNYICDCAECNSSRGNTDFDEWMEEVPDMQNGLQVYVNDVVDAIARGYIHVSCYPYLGKMSRTVEDLSNGEILLEIPEQPQVEEDN